MAKLRTLTGQVLFVNPDHVSHIWENPATADQCTLVIRGTEMTQVKGSAQYVALLLQAEAHHGS